MKDFSLFYGPLRTWLPVVAMAALAMVVFVTQTGSSDAPCDPAAVECSEPLVGERQLLGNGDGLDVTPAGLPTEAEADDGPSPWDDFDPSTSEVPFVSLQPSPEPMTEAGEELVRSTPSAGEDADRP